MRHQDLIEDELIRKSFGPRHRIIKQVSALRKKDPLAFPTGTKKHIAKEVTAQEASRLFVLLSLNPNPFNAAEFDRAFSCFEILDVFLKDLSKIIEAQGISLDGERVVSVFISLDRPHAIIKFAGKYVHEYGESDSLPKVEHYAVINSETLQEWASRITNPKYKFSEEEQRALMQEAIAAAKEEIL